MIQVITKHEADQQGLFLMLDDGNAYQISLISLSSSLMKQGALERNLHRNRLVMRHYHQQTHHLHHRHGCDLMALVR